MKSHHTCQIENGKFDGFELFGQDKAVEDAATKKQAKEKYTAAMDIWKVREMDRKQRNVMLKSRWDKEVKAWNVE